MIVTVHTDRALDYDGIWITYNDQYPRWLWQHRYPLEVVHRRALQADWATIRRHIKPGEAGYRKSDDLQRPRP